jgi:hypothetical protein
MAKPTFDRKMRLIGQSRDRTGDLRIFSPSLYQLSYLSAGLPSKPGADTVQSASSHRLILNGRKDVAMAKKADRNL